MVTQAQRSAPTGQKYTCMDGPFLGYSLFLSDPRTLTFSVRGREGFYAYRGGNGLHWHPTAVTLPPLRAIDGAVVQAPRR